MQQPELPSTYLQRIVCQLCCKHVRSSLACKDELFSFKNISQSHRRNFLDVSYVFNDLSNVRFNGGAEDGKGKSSMLVVLLILLYVDLVTGELLLKNRVGDTSVLISGA